MDVFERALVAARHEEPDEVPVVLQVYGLVLKAYPRVLEYDYYQDVRMQLEAKVAFLRRFPEVMNMPMGVFPEGGEFLGPVPCAFGAKLSWMKDAPPYISDYPVKTPEDIDRLVEAGVPDPYEVGFVADTLRRIRYFWDWFPRDLRESHGCMDGTVFAPTFIEGAALTMGYDKFIIWLRLYPDAIHKLLRHVTRWVKVYCKAQEEITGRCRLFWLPDHMPSQVGPKQFGEFMLPYMNEVFGSYKGALRIWHNEGSCGHMLEAVDKIDAEVWHFGASDDPALCKERTHFCLQGNLHPPGVMVKGTPEDVVEASRKVIEAAGEGGGLWLSTGGGMAPGTPFQNIEAMLRAVEKYGKYPLRRR
jgi:uroporphyrinogen-III decarboxylase